MREGYISYSLLLSCRSLPYAVAEHRSLTLIQGQRCRFTCMIAFAWNSIECYVVRLHYYYMSYCYYYYYYCNAHSIRTTHTKAFKRKEIVNIFSILPLHTAAVRR